MAPVEFALTDTESALMNEPMPQQQQQPRGHRGFLIVVAVACVGAFVIGRASVGGVVTQAAVDGATQLQVSEDGNATSGNASGNASAPVPLTGPPDFVASGGGAEDKKGDLVCPKVNSPHGSACVTMDHGPVEVIAADTDVCVNRGDDGAGGFVVNKEVTSVSTNGDIRITWYRTSDCQDYENLQANLGSCGMCASDQSINLPNDRFFWLKNAQSFKIHSCPPISPASPMDCDEVEPRIYDHKNDHIPVGQVRNPITGQVQDQDR